jgi:hypothetical protein
VAAAVTRRTLLPALPFSPGIPPIYIGGYPGGTAWVSCWAAMARPAIHPVVQAA